MKKHSRLFKAPVFEIRHIGKAEELWRVIEISREIGRRNAEGEARQLAAILRDTPDNIRIYIAYDGDETVGCLRIHFANSSELAELCGARTKTTHRRRGVFTSLVARSLEDARTRGCKHMIADALPTSEPILRKNGFLMVTDTQPFVFRPGL